MEHWHRFVRLAALGTSSDSRKYSPRAPARARSPGLTLSNLCGALVFGLCRARSRTGFCVRLQERTSSDERVNSSTAGGALAASSVAVGMGLVAASASAQAPGDLPVAPAGATEGVTGGRRIRRSIVNEVCWGGGKRVLNGFRKLYTCGIQRSYGPTCLLAWLVYVAMVTTLSAPIWGLVYYMHVRSGVFFGAFSLFGIVPLLYLHSLWYFHRPYIVQLFDEVCSHGAEFARDGERVIRRHIFAMVILVPVSAMVMVSMLFATDPLTKFVRASHAKALRAASLPVFFFSMILLAVPIIFAATFSIAFSLLRLLTRSFEHRIATERPSVRDMITMHRHLQDQLTRHTSHWRWGYTLCGLLSFIGLALMFYSVTVSHAFLRELIPFASTLVFFTLALQLFFLWCIVRLSETCNQLGESFSRLELTLPVDTMDRVILSMHNASRPLRFAVLGFTGMGSVDAVLAVMCLVVVFYLDRLAG